MSAFDNNGVNRIKKIGIIGGSGFADLKFFDKEKTEEVITPYGKPSSALAQGVISDQQIVFIARHGNDHTILPHRVNYRGNLWALKQAEVTCVIAIATVGGIGMDCHPGTIVVPDQILDYTHSREHTFSPVDGSLFHIDFTQPYCESLRRVLIVSADGQNIEVLDRGTYAATQGPRFESAAEINRLDKDGADIVGMTGMPETSLAREIGLCYATLAVVVNYAAGRSGTQISVDEIRQAYQQATEKVQAILSSAISRLQDFECEVPQVITP